MLENMRIDVFGDTLHGIMTQTEIVSRFVERLVGALTNGAVLVLSRLRWRVDHKRYVCCSFERSKILRQNRK